MSAAGRVTFTSASSSGRRGSPPWRMSSTATASRSMSRTTAGSPSWFACAASRSRVSSVSGSESGTSPMCWTSISARRCSSRSRTSRAEVLALRRELLDERERAGGVVVDDEVAEAEERLLLDRAEQLQHGLHRDLALGRGGELVERRLGVADTRRARRARSAPAPGRARRCPRRPRCGAASSRAPAKRGRWKTNVWQRERTVGSTLARSVVQKTKTRCGGGSSISLSSAFQAASVSWCASSRM